MMRSRSPPNIRHILMNNDPNVKITLLFDYIIDYISMIQILCQYDKYPLSYTIRKPTFYSAHEDAVDTVYLSVVYYT
jgi:hypothetical protein